jgi:hypothetical protein
LSKPPPPKKQAQSPRGEEPGLIPNHKVMPEVYFGDQTFWLRNDDGRFIAANTEVVRRRLKRRGFSGENTKSLNSEIDNILDDISNQHGVDYVGPLAGYDVGAHEILDTRVLVTRGPKIIDGNPDYSDDMVHAYIETLLGDESVYFHAWLKTVRENLKARTFRRTPVLVIAGEPDTGKSFLAKHVKTMIGGRVQDPTQFLQGKTTFNSHLFGAEFLLIDDAGGNADYQERKAMGDGLKQLVAGAFPQCHGKGQTPVTLLPFWCVMMTVNDEAEPLQVLPNLAGGVRDKMVIIRTVAKAHNVDTSKTEAHAKYWDDFEAAIPDYLGWLEQWEIPDEIAHGRFGMASYVNAGIEEILNQFTPEEKLSHLIMEEVQSDADQELTARDIEKLLKAPGVSSVEREAVALLRGPGSCQKYLGRLCKTHPRLIRHHGRGTGGYARYLICARKAVKKGQE